MSKEYIRINYQIRVPNVRLIAEDGSQLGIKTIQEALALAQNAGLDLVEIAPKAVPPVCKIIDYYKFKYIQEKKMKTPHKTGVLKEIKMRPKIGEHDLGVKINHIKRFLEEKNKVKITMQFFGREKEHMSLGTDIVKRIIETISELGVPDSEPKRFGNSMTVIISPVVKKSASEQKKPM